MTYESVKYKYRGDISPTLNTSDYIYVRNKILNEKFLEMFHALRWMFNTNEIFLYVNDQRDAQFL